MAVTTGDMNAPAAPPPADELPAEFPPSVLILREPDGAVVLAVPDRAALTRVAREVLSARFLAGWYPPVAPPAPPPPEDADPDANLVWLRSCMTVGERVGIRGHVVRVATAASDVPDAWEVLHHASTLAGHPVELVALTPPSAYATRRPDIG